MTCIIVDNIFKFYDKVKAVDGVSFKVDAGEIFGLLGPNGAGKSSTIRMLLDFIKPDKGTISICGKFFSEKTKETVGYLPEERGLYDDLSVMENLCYLAALKGSTAKEAKMSGLLLLNNVGLIDKSNVKVGSLSKGQRQLVQLCVTLIHHPTILILDEPFSGLDPTNRELVKKIILEEKRLGRTILLSTHMMNEVEELCDRALMINHGKRVLYGRIDEIKKSYASNCVFVGFEGTFPELEGVERSNITNNSAQLFLRVDTTSKNILKQLVNADLEITRFDVKELSLNQIFIKVAEAEKWIKQ